MSTATQHGPQLSPQSRRATPFTRDSLAIAGILFVTASLSLAVVGSRFAFVREDIMMIQLFQSYSVDVSRVFTDGWQGLYGDAFPWINWSYRPLEMLGVDWALTSLFGENEALQIAFKSAVIGLLGSLIYLTGIELTGRRFVAGASAVFSLLSLPVIIEAWWFHHVAGYSQVIVLFGLLSFLLYRRLRRRRWYVAFAAAALIGPLVGEYAILLPLTALAVTLAETVETRRSEWREWDWLLLGTSLALLLLGLFPQFLPNLLINRDIVLSGVFARSYLAMENEPGLLSFIQPGAPYEVVIAGLPPMLSAAAFLSLAGYYVRRRHETPNFMIMGFGLLIILAVIFALNYPPPRGSMTLQPTTTWYYVLPTLFPVAFAVLSYPVNRFLALWFLLSYLPFVRFLHLPVNMIVVIVPWILLCFVWIQRLFDDVLPQGFGSLALPFMERRKAVVALTLAGALSLGVYSQGLNIVAAAETWGKAANNTREMGRFAAARLPAGSIVLGEENSFFEALAMAYYSGQRIDANLVVYDDLWWPLQQVHARDLVPFLADGAAYDDKYILLQDGLDGALYRHWSAYPEEFERVARFEVASTIPLIDPLYLFLPNDMLYFVGPNIANLSVSSDGPLHSRFNAAYTLYHYVGGERDRVDRRTRREPAR